MSASDKLDGRNALWCRLKAVEQTKVADLPICREANKASATVNFNMQSKSLRLFAHFWVINVPNMKIFGHFEAY